MPLRMPAHVDGLNRCGGGIMGNVGIALKLHTATSAQPCIALSCIVIPCTFHYKWRQVAHGYFSAILYSTVLHFTTLYCTTLYCTTLYTFTMLVHTTSIAVPCPSLSFNCTPLCITFHITAAFNCGAQMYWVWLNSYIFGMHCNITRTRHMIAVPGVSLMMF